MDNLSDTKKRKYIGEKIRQARVLTKLSQDDLGKILNVRNTIISRIELGQRDVRAAELELIAGATNQPVKFFLEEEKPEIKPSKYIDVSDLDSKEIEIIQATVDKIREVKKERSA